MRFSDFSAVFSKIPKIERPNPQPEHRKGELDGPNDLQSVDNTHGALYKHNGDTGTHRDVPQGAFSKKISEISEISLDEIS